MKKLIIFVLSLSLFAFSATATASFDSDYEYLTDYCAVANTGPMDLDCTDQDYADLYNEAYSSVLWRFLSTYENPLISLEEKIDFFSYELDKVTWFYDSLSEESEDHSYEEHFVVESITHILDTMIKELRTVMYGLIQEYSGDLHVWFEYAQDWWPVTYAHNFGYSWKPALMFHTPEYVSDVDPMMLMIVDEQSNIASTHEQYVDAWSERYSVCDTEHIELSNPQWIKMIETRLYEEVDTCLLRANCQPSCEYKRQLISFVTWWDVYTIHNTAVIDWVHNVEKIIETLSYR